MNIQKVEKYIIFCLVFLSISGSFFLAGCDSIVNPSELLDQSDPLVNDEPEVDAPEEEPVEDPIPDPDQINAYINSLQHIPQPTETGIISEGTADPTDPDSPSPLIGYTNSITKYSAVLGFNTHTCLDTQSDVIWPGSLLIGDTITEGGYTLLTLERRPMAFSISFSNVNGSIIGYMNEAKLSQAREQIQTLLSPDELDSENANSTFAIKDIYSPEQLNQAMGTHYTGFGVKPDTLYNFSNQTIRTRKLVKYSQIFYTIDIDIPATPADFFSENVFTEDIEQQMDTGISPVYISSISYGKAAWYAIESSASPEELNAAINYAHSGYTPENEADCIEILNNASITVMLLGGNSAPTIQTINGFSAFEDWVNGGGDFSDITPGAPLSYCLRYLSDNSIARIVLDSEYYIRECEKLINQYRLLLYSAQPKDILSFYSGKLDFIIYTRNGSNDNGAQQTILLDDFTFLFSLPVPVLLAGDSTVTFSYDDIENGYIELIVVQEDVESIKRLYLSNLSPNGEDGMGYYYCDCIAYGPWPDPNIGQVRFGIEPIE